MEFPNILNMRKVSDESKVSYSKLYFRKIGHTKEGLEMNDKVRVANAIVSKLKPFFKAIGFELTLRRVETD